MASSPEVFLLLDQSGILDSELWFSWVGRLWEFSSCYTCLLFAVRSHGVCNGVGV